MKRYTCAKCGYSTTKETQPARCNYCSKPGTMRPESNASQLLADDE